MKSTNSININNGDRIFRLLGILISLALISWLVKTWQVDEFFLNIISLLSPLFVGVVIAWFLNPIVKKLESKGIKHGLGVFAAYVIALLFLLGFIGLLSLVVKEAVDFVTYLPTYAKDLEQFLTNLDTGMLSQTWGFDITVIMKTITDFLNYVSENLLDLIYVFASFLGKTLLSLKNFGLGLLISIYLLIDYKKVLEIAPRIIPKKFKNRTVRIMKSLDLELGAYVRGMLIDSFIVFLVSTLFLSLIGLKYAIVFGAIIGVTNVIQYIGPFIGGAPAVLIAFIQDWRIGLMTLVAIIVIQSLESAFLQPFIVGKLTKIHPAVSIAGLAVFSGLFGFIGALLSTPLIILCKIIGLHVNEKFDIFDLETTADTI